MKKGSNFISHLISDFRVNLEYFDSQRMLTEIVNKKCVNYRECINKYI